VNKLLSDRIIVTKVFVSMDRARRKPLFFCALFSVIFFMMAPHKLQAQEENNKKEQAKTETPANADSIKPHSPKKAALYSAALPGLGQAYNKKYWKIPIIYAGFGTLVYFIDNNNTEYNKFKAAYSYVISEDTGEPPNEYVERYESNSEKLRKIKDFYRRNLELSYILSGALYILNILDATVDAHFFHFDVDKDLSLEVSPYIRPAPMRHAIYADKGISITLNL